MKLEKRTYTRKEIADITKTNIKDTKHFKRNASAILIKWGYGFDWISPKQIEITHCPFTIEEQIKEYAIRILGADSRINGKSFGIFFFLLCNDFEFNSAPWLKKTEIMKENYGIEITDRTLRKWSNKLSLNNLLTKEKKEIIWVTKWN